MDYLPIFMTIRKRPCVIIGGGSVAARKTALLLQAQADVTVVSPQLCPTLQELQQQGRITHRPQAFSPSDLDGQTLAIAATNDEAVNQQVSALCQARSLPVNVVDQPDLCSFIMPALIDRSPILIAISTGGAAPVLARLLRGRLESLIPATYGRLAALASSLREAVQQKIPAPQRRAFWESVLQGPIAEMVLSGREAAARSTVEAMLERGTDPKHTPGEVYLVGGGPGDPDLLTFRALRLMQQADVVVYDRLVSPAVLELTRRDAERVYAGKQRSDHSVPQDTMNQLLIDLARSGKRVLRLKGGDPFIFGRGGEELQALAQAGIPFQVVPGITAASGCASFAGIPLTHRDYAHSCLFVTAHVQNGQLSLNWPALVQPQQTLVFYMGQQGLRMICSKLVEHGLSADTPAALVERGTLPDQRVHSATLADLPQCVESSAIKPPALIIVGNVVKLHRELAWFKP